MKTTGVDGYRTIMPLPDRTVVKWEETRVWKADIEANAFNLATNEHEENVAAWFVRYEIRATKKPIPVGEKLPNQATLDKHRTSVFFELSENQADSDVFVTAFRTSMYSLMLPHDCIRLGLGTSGEPTVQQEARVVAGMMSHLLMNVASGRVAWASYEEGQALMPHILDAAWVAQLK